MTDTTDFSPREVADRAATDRAVDLRMARLHLRLGSLALARAELESMAGADMLDDDGLVDLAEVRWRTGDLDGAGEAAAAVVRDDDGPVLALIIAAEAAMARGRPTEARKFATAASRRAGGHLDALFAGMPRAAVWPPDPIAPVPSTATMFDGPSSPLRPMEPRRVAAATAAAIVTDAGSALDIPEAAVAAGAGAAIDDAHGPSLWSTVEATDDDRTANGIDDAERIYERGVQALASGRLDDAALAFGLALRLGPALAPTIIDRLLDRDEPGLALVRGDAYRLVGRESDARATYAAAARRAGPAETVRPGDPDPDDAPDPDRSDPRPESRPDPQGDSA